jgi:hypothetical protein
MRLKEDNISWRVSAILKRDFRHDHSEGETKHRSHKPTNKWCRGKVGVRHAIIWSKKPWLFGVIMHTGRCSNCGKLMYRAGKP